MNNPLKNIFALPKGMLLFLGLYAVSFPVIFLEMKINHRSVLVDWLGLSPALVWKGQVWRLMSYALLGGGVLGWAINLFWFATLVSILRNDWSSLSFWICCLVAAAGGALPVVLIYPHADVPVLTAGAVVFALLAAWDRFYRRERIIMLGIGEVSVRQAAIFIAVLNVVICFFSCGGWLITLAMICGGAVGWLWLAIGQRRVMSRGSQVVESQRAARLEL
jgi:membrane associated rhomboid family serine protease